MRRRTVTMEIEEHWSSCLIQCSSHFICLSLLLQFGSIELPTAPIHLHKICFHYQRKNSEENRTNIPTGESTCICWIVSITSWYWFWSSSFKCSERLQTLNQ